MAQRQEIEDLVNGRLRVPLPMYFGIGNSRLPGRVIEKLQTSGNLCENLFFLGRRSTLKTSEGIKIATLGGTLVEVTDANIPGLGQYDPSFTVKDARTLHGAHHVDILVTNQWPKGVWTGSERHLERESELPAEIDCIADLCSTLKPRYHFSSCPAYYSREPFFHPVTADGSEQARVTRFEALAPFGNKSKEKWFYAFKYDPNGPSTTALPPDATRTPFSSGRKRPAATDPTDGYKRYANGSAYTDERPKRSRKKDYNRLEHCFFCISSPTVQKHLITSMANESYLTTTRGPLPPPGWSSDLNIPCHLLIIPHTHVDDHAPREQRAHLSPPEYDEMQRYRRALCRMLQAKGNGKYGGLCWEISRSGIRHVHWQFVAVPSHLISGGLVQAGFKVAAEKAELPGFQSYDAHEMVTDQGDYFRIWIWKPAGAGSVPGLVEQDEAIGLNGSGKNDRDNMDDEHGTETSMVMPIPSSEKIDIQFGRKVTAGLLSMSNRANWRDVVQTVEEETADAKDFQEAFEPYDPALVEDQAG